MVRRSANCAAIWTWHVNHNDLDTAPPVEARTLVAEWQGRQNRPLAIGV
jgi:hypothetical protein